MLCPLPGFHGCPGTSGKTGSLVTEAMEVLLRVIFQCWQLPLRNNHTDAHPICVDRFRGHVWWIGSKWDYLPACILCCCACYAHLKYPEFQMKTNPVDNKFAEKYKNTGYSDVLCTAYRSSGMSI